MVMIRLVKTMTTIGDGDDQIGEDDNRRWLVGIEDLDLSEKPLGRNLPKYLVLGGETITLAYTIDHGLLIKAVIFSFD
ncbi:hypothetical protein ACH5RR_018345, partial [Cinchona calisaya]